MHLLHKVRRVFQALVSSALDFTLDKFTKFVEKTIDYDNDEAYISVNPLLIPVSKTETVTLSNGETINLTTLSGRDWDINSWEICPLSFRRGRFFLFTQW